MISTFGETGRFPQADEPLAATIWNPANLVYSYFVQERPAEPALRLNRPKQTASANSFGRGIGAGAISPVLEDL